MQQRLRLETQIALLSVLALSAVACGKPAASASPASTSQPAASQATAQSAAQAAAKPAADTDEPPNLFMGHIDPKTLGIPIYPGAKPSEGVGIASSGKDGNGRMVNLTTPDSFAAVSAWYKANLPAGTGNTSLNGTGHSMITFQVSTQPNDAKVVMVATEGDHTSITLTAAHNETAPSTAAPASAATGDHADLSSLGLPVYPNVFESAWVGNMSDDTQTTRQGNMSTHDAFDKVYAWYKQKMPAGSEGGEASASNHLTDDGDHAAMFQIGTTADPKSKMVMITQNKGDEATIVVLIDHTTK
jgi:hypothetical protein